MLAAASCACVTATGAGLTASLSLPGINYVIAAELPALVAKIGVVTVPDIKCVPCPRGRVNAPPSHCCVGGSRCTRTLTPRKHPRSGNNDGFAWQLQGIACQHISLANAAAALSPPSSLLVTLADVNVACTCSWVRAGEGGGRGCASGDSYTTAHPSIREGRFDAADSRGSNFHLSSRLVLTPLTLLIAFRTFTSQAGRTCRMALAARP